MVKSASALLLLAGSAGIITGASASPTRGAQPLPLVIWHGLGDSAGNEGLQSVADLYTSIYPGAKTHIISLADDADADRKAAYFGSLPNEVVHVCEQIASIPELSADAAPYGIHALGFSQGGLFMRGYVEMCNHIVKVHTLVTFGSPHNGMAQFAKCKPTDWLCRGAFGLLDANMWTNWVQRSIVPAQYYRHPSEEQMQHYLESSGFLADINNERDEKNSTYKDNLGNMDGGLVLYKFNDDEVIIPQESVWFAEVSESGEIEWLTDRELYKEDWLGLKKLSDEGKLKFVKTPGGHMHIDDELLTEIYTKYLWQPEGVVPRNVDGTKHNRALASLALPYQKGEEQPLLVQHS